MCQQQLEREPHHDDHPHDSSTTSTSNGGGGSGATGGGGSGGQNTGNGICDQIGANHLLISEVEVQPAAGEFIEIWNPGANAVNLDKYYLSDNAAYHGIAAGTAWNPVANQFGTDFLAAFPPGTSIGPNQVLVIQVGTGFSTTFGSCPDFELLPEASADVLCGTQPPTVVPKLVEPTNGGIGDSTGNMLSNTREMVILFCWDGGSHVTDVDYVTWGPDDPTEPTRVDKSAVPGYAADTPRATQAGATAPVQNESIGRCSNAETGEATSGGNGPGGHDETSENMATTFTVFTDVQRSPGVLNPCIN